MSDLPRYPGAPRWAKLLAIVGIGLILLMLILHLAGFGGPARHGTDHHQRFGRAAGGAPATAHEARPL